MIDENAITNQENDDCKTANVRQSGNVKLIYYATITKKDQKAPVPFRSFPFL